MCRIWCKRIFGVVAFLIGLTLMGWFVYNQIWPTEEFKTGFRSIFQLIPAIACLVVGWSWMRYQGKSIEEISPPDLKISQLDEARVQAHARLPEFIAHVEQGKDEPYVKFPLVTPSGLTEHIWAYVHFYKDGMFNVSLANQPIDEAQPADGRRNVPQAEVEDWMISNPDGTLRGAFSLIALFRYHEERRVKLSPLMKKQKAMLLDAAG